LAKILRSFKLTNLLCDGQEKHPTVADRANLQDIDYGSPKHHQPGKNKTAISCGVAVGGFLTMFTEGGAQRCKDCSDMRARPECDFT
jgi:hypothetical protein